eukprot:6053677-Pleurochrysis_carterae.AAC.1
MSRISDAYQSFWLRASIERRRREIGARILAENGVPISDRWQSWVELMESVHTWSSEGRSLYRRWGSSFMLKAELGHERVCGRSESCLVDAVCNAAKEVGVALKVSAMRKIALQPIPGDESNVCASWRLIQRALQAQQAPIAENPCKPKFDAKGPVMLNLVRHREGAYVLCLRVTVDGRVFFHAIAYNAVDGILIDNHSSNRPMRLDDRDRRGRRTASAAFRRLLSQRSGFEHK